MIGFFLKMVSVSLSSIYIYILFYLKDIFTQFNIYYIDVYHLLMNICDA